MTNEVKMHAKPVAIKTWARGRTIIAELTDGGIIGCPADRFEILPTADDQQLKEITIRLNGYALR